MALTVSKQPSNQTGQTPMPPSTALWRPFDSLRREVDRLFEDFNGGFWRWPQRLDALVEAPAVDVAEKENEYEITAELPGMTEKDIEVKMSNGALVIRGEKKQEREEKKKDYHLSERRYGSFERTFGLPDGIDADKVAATFEKGVLTVRLPKSAEAQKQEKHIAIKAA